MKQKDTTLAQICPIRNVISRFGNKWAILVIVTLNENKILRFNELHRKIPDISTKMLASTLRILDEDGLVSRKVYPTVPPKVEYTLTESGKSLIPIIRQLTDWAQNNMKTIVQHRLQCFT